MSQTSCRCSTPQRNWSQREGSNLRPDPYEGPDLPLIYSAGIGADGGGRTRISTMASRILSVEPRPRIGGDTRTRTEIFWLQARSPPFERCPHKSQNECRCGRLDGSWSGLPRTCRVDGNDCLWPKMKNPSRSGPEGFADLSIVARIFYPGGTPPHRLGCPILTSMTCPHDAPPNHRCRYSGRVKARPDVSRDFMS